jgi:hypothetical protein
VNSRRLVLALLAVPIVAAAAVAVGVAARDGGARGTGSAAVERGSAEAEAVVVPAESSVHATSLAELIDASDTVVIGRVLSTQRGRLVAGERGSGFVTRLVRLQVDEVLAGEEPGEELIVEEPGWLTDGSPIAVNGVPGSVEGDLGIWFLIRGTDPDAPYFAVVNDQGRYLVDPHDETRFRDVPVSDPLIDQLERTEPIILRHQVQEAAGVLRPG